MKSLWGALDAASRAKNQRGAEAAKRYYEATKPKPSLPSPEKFIQEGVAESYLERAPNAPAEAGGFVLVDSPEGRAWLTLHRIAMMVSPRTFYRQGKDYFWLKRELEARELACGQAPDDRAWKPTSNIAQMKAWRDFLQEAIGRAVVGDFSVPWTWPPRKDGTLYASGSDPPPDTLMSEEDERYLAEG